ncbi:sulfatase-like hydrolase/transferase [Labilibaculum antarcticum]|uniref:Sulfatase n=1 Tax=Labilibaculum antarcticum TaxID=1717717 RepID=A0A1Y1CLB5_9BACT|nr:sulfatase-like hydrolase/transferase [Labilibaculum antarcticum]BAX81135.1 sulfatase [Labilibaculum antarcticum]
MRQLKVYFFVALFLAIHLCSNAGNKKRPNVLFAISDDQTFAHTGFAGCTFVNTPAFDRIAGEGIYFSNCYAGSPGCAPSRSSIVTGRYPWQNEQSGQHASSWMKKYVPFVDELADNGYAVGRTGKGVDPFRYALSAKDSLWRVGNAGGTLHSEISYDESDDERFATGIKNMNYFEDFKYFLDSVRQDKPFFFWYGAKEPHRGYEKGSWKQRGKKLTDVQVPKFLPDNEIIRGDLLDYAVEIEWFDLHLQRMLEHLEKIGELENTIVIVTSDNGMPFPRAKANCYEYGAHVPLAIRYPKDFPGNRVVNAPASFINLAPTILEMCQTDAKNMQAITGKSMVKLLENKRKANENTAVFSGRERHTSARYQNWGYPQRVIRKGDYLLVWNVKPERWPAGAPQTYDTKDTTQLKEMYQGTVFADIDGSPSKSFLLNEIASGETNSFFRLACEKRDEFELFDLSVDESSVLNIIDNEANKEIADQLKRELIRELVRTNDPRVVGPDKEIFDSYKRYSKIRKFPRP